MKVVHLSLSNDGGAGIAAYRLHTTLRGAGVDSLFLTLYSKNDDPSVMIVDTTTRPCLRIGPGMSPHFYIYEQRRLFLMEQHPERQKNRALFADASSEVVLEVIPEIREADIVNLHWVAGMVDYARIGHTLKGKRVVWTLHGMNDFTGGCHHADECRKYTTECSSCPQLGSHLFDYARHIFNQKLHGMQPLDLTAVSPSRWLARCAAESTILTGREVHRIPNGIPTDIFRPVDGTEARRFFGISPDRQIVLFGAFDAANERKGFKLLTEAFRHLPPERCARITVVGFGSSSEALLASLPCEVKGVGPVCDEGNLALIYSMADLFVMPSMAENLPSSILESLACGTPVAAFGVGGIPEIIEHQVNGYLAAPFDSRELAEGIAWCLQNNTRTMADRCVQTVRYGFDGRNQALRYLALYQQLLNHGKTD